MIGEQGNRRTGRQENDPSQDSDRAASMCYVASMRPLRLAAFVSALSVLSAALVQSSEPSVAWPQFRGPSGAGILSEGKLPV
ncbi:MAG: hypothetical protein RLZZ53_733, partial [Acidobacteriota bacterium]